MIFSGGYTVMLAGDVTDDPPESDTLTMNENPPAVGVLPETAPSDESDKPGGSEPPARDHEYGPTPPVAVSVTAAYESPTSPLWTGALATAKGAVGVGLGLGVGVVSGVTEAVWLVPVSVHAPPKRTKAAASAAARHPPPI